MAISLNEVAFVRRLPLFETLADEAVYELLSEAVVRFRPRHTLLFVQDDEADRFFVILGGWVKLFRQTARGEEAIIEVFGPGESFAEAAMFGPGGYPVSAEIVADARLLEVPSAAFKRRLQADSRLAMNMLGVLSAKLRRFVALTERLKTRTTVERVGGFLLHFCPPGRGSAEIELPYDKHLIAGRLGMKPETFSRALARLRPLGVRVNGTGIVLADAGKLREFLARGGR